MPGTTARVTVDSASLLSHQSALQGTCQIHWLPEFNSFRKQANEWPRGQTFKQMKLENAH
jgi:hypothetical protein